MEFDIFVFNIIMGDQLFNMIAFYIFIFKWIYWPFILYKFSYVLHLLAVYLMFFLYFLVSEVRIKEEVELANKYDKIHSQIYWVAKQHLPPNIFYTNYIEPDLAELYESEYALYHLHDLGFSDDLLWFDDEEERDIPYYPVDMEASGLGEDHPVANATFEGTAVPIPSVGPNDFDQFFELHNSRREAGEPSSRLNIVSQYGDGDNDSDILISDTTNSDLNDFIPSSEPKTFKFNFMLPFGMKPVQFSVKSVRVMHGMHNADMSKFDEIISRLRKARHENYKLIHGQTYRPRGSNWLRVFKNSKHKKKCSDILYTNNGYFGINSLHKLEQCNDSAFAISASADQTDQMDYTYNDPYIWPMDRHGMSLMSMFFSIFGEYQANVDPSQILVLDSAMDPNMGSWLGSSTSYWGRFRSLSRNEYDAYTLYSSKYYQAIYEHKFIDLIKNAATSEDRKYYQKLSMHFNNQINAVTYVPKLPEVIDLAPFFDSNKHGKFRIFKKAEYAESFPNLSRIVADETTAYDAYAGTKHISEFISFEHAPSRGEFTKVSPTRVTVVRRPIFWPDNYSNRPGSIQEEFRFQGIIRSMDKYRSVIVDEAARNIVKYHAGLWGDMPRFSSKKFKFSGLYKFPKICTAKHKYFSYEKYFTNQRFFDRAGIEQWGRTEPDMIDDYYDHDLDQEIANSVFSRAYGQISPYSETFVYSNKNRPSPETLAYQRAFFRASYDWPDWDKAGWK